VHMNGLGIPILGDNFYPDLIDTPLDDFRRPLQLLASTVEFQDPFTGTLRRFRTRLELQAWTSYEEWASPV
jgi:tRNA pseudouridine32 synthase / 23S rRNA pseudouridine746 synthase